MPSAPNAVFAKLFAALLAQGTPGWSGGSVKCVSRINSTTIPLLALVFARGMLLVGPTNGRRR